MSPTYVIGDVHGHLDRLMALLRHVELLGRDGAWRGGQRALWLMGDLVDRGPDGVPVIELVMRLQQEAANAGGRLGVLLGNHDALFLGADRFGTAPSSGPGGSFLAAWRQFGGEPRDLRRLTAEQRAWLSNLPAMAREGETLLMHADATLYLHYGQTIADVNQAITNVLDHDDPGQWDRLLDVFEEHRAFVNGAAGEGRARAMLARFGGTRIVHGHSPISTITGEPAALVDTPLIYADGLCIDVDGGIYRGGPGFVYRLPRADR